MNQLLCIGMLLVTVLPYATSASESQETIRYDIAKRHYIQRIIKTMPDGGKLTNYQERIDAVTTTVTCKRIDRLCEYTGFQVPHFGPKLQPLSDTPKREFLRLQALWEKERQEAQQQARNKPKCSIL